MFLRNVICNVVNHLEGTEVSHELIELDAKSPVPLFHQIAEQLRARIRAGEIGPGDRLATLRDAAEAWGVHLHTVRHAYAELAREGLVTSKGRAGTRVSAPGPAAETDSSPGASSDRFLDSLVASARRQHGWSADELMLRLASHLAGETSGPPAVHVVECSRAQAEDLATQISSVFGVEAVGHCLEELEQLPEGSVVATYFHYNEIRRRWPLRLSETHFVGIAPMAGLARVLERRLGRPPAQALVAETDQPTAEAVAADVVAALGPSKIEVQSVVLSVDAELPAGEPDAPVLFPPRTWASLSDEQRSAPYRFPLRYVFDAFELQALANGLGWKRRGAEYEAPEMLHQPTRSGADHDRVSIDIDP